MVKKLDSNAARLKRHKRVRAKISGTPERPRLNVFRSAKHIYAQIIDDVTGTTLVSASSMDKGFEGSSWQSWQKHCEQSSREGYFRGRIRPQRLHLSWSCKRAG